MKKSGTVTKIFFSIFLFLFSLQIVFASDASHREVVNEVYQHGDFAQYQVALHNDKWTYDSYLITFKDVYWSIKAVPLTDYTTGVDVGPNETTATTLLIKPQEGVPPGRYNVEITYLSKNTGEKVVDVYTIIVDKDPVIPIHYEPNVTVKPVVSEIFGLGKINSVELSFLNNNPLDLSSVNVKLASKSFSQETIVQIGPREDKIVDFSISLNEKYGGINDVLAISVSTNNSLLYSAQIPFFISTAGNIKEKVVKSETFFTKTFTYAYTNVGTTDVLYKIRIPTNYWNALFTSTYPSLKLFRDKEGLFYSGTEEIVAGSSFELRVFINYFLIVYFIVLVLFVLFLYYMLRSPVIVTKEATKVDIVEGGIASVHIVISIKNRSARLLKTIKITDKIPAIAQMDKKGEPIKPTKVYPFNGGTAVQYDIHSLESREQIFVNYTMKTRLGVLGNLRLPPTIVQFNSGKKKAYSNPVDVYTP